MDIADLLRDDRPVFQVLGSPDALNGHQLWARSAPIADAVNRGAGGKRLLVALMLPQDERLVTALTAAHRAGVPVAPLYPSLRADEVRDVFAVIRPGVVVSERKDLGEILGAIASVNPVRKADSVWKVEYRDGLDRELAVPADLVINSSGSTGRPKGIVLDGSVALRNARHFGQRLGLQAGSRYYCPLPFAHSGGLVMGWWAAATTGALLLTSPEFEPSRSAQLLAELNLDLIGAVDTMFFRWAAERRDRPLGQSAWSTGDEATLRRIQRDGGFAHVVRPYGLTECSPNVGVGDPSRPGAPPADPRIWVHEGIRVKIDAAALGAESDAGAEGEILVSGWSLGRGYLTSTGIAPLPLDQGWLRTGDLGRFNPEGALLFTGRLKEMLKVGGLNVWPQEIEKILGELVSSTVCVVGLKDAEYGEVPVGVVGGRTSNEDVERLVAAGLRLPRIKRPKAFYSLGRELPVTPSGKLDRRLITNLVNQGEGVELRIEFRQH